jgi:HAD superfamily hydrolase (TIGR01509 family)
MSQYKAVLFDLDGVLVDAPEWHYEALNQALSLFGYSITREEHEGWYNGLPTRKKLDRLSADKGLSAALHSIIYETKQLYTADAINTNCRPEFGKQTMMKTLKDHGIKIAVCSNAIRDSLENMLKRGALLEYVDLILSNQDVEKNKPDPEIYLLAMKQLDVKPEECIIVEDAPHGVEAAKASGGTVIRVRNAAEVNITIFRQHLTHIHI